MRCCGDPPCHLCHLVVRYLQNAPNLAASSNARFVRHLRADWKPERKRRAVPAAARHLDCSSVKLDDLFDEIEADAGAGDACGASGAEIALEHLRKVVGIDADAFVAHPDADAFSFLPAGHMHIGGIWRVFHGIREEVAEDLVESGLIAEDDRREPV